MSSISSFVCGVPYWMPRIVMVVLCIAMTQIAKYTIGHETSVLVVSFFVLLVIAVRWQAMCT